MFQVHPHRSVCQYSTPSHGWIEFHHADKPLCLSIQWLVDIWVIYAFLPFMGIATARTPSFLLCVDLGVELLVYILTLCLTFWGIATPFSTAVEPFYIPTSNRWQFRSSIVGWLPILFCFVLNFLTESFSLWDLSSMTRDWMGIQWQWKHRVLTTGPPGNFLRSTIFETQFLSQTLPF